MSAATNLSDTTLTSNGVALDTGKNDMVEINRIFNRVGTLLAPPSYPV